jgi:hypothetical protein
MMPTTRLPLPLELTQPVLLAGDGEFDLKAQLCSATGSNQNTRTTSTNSVIADVAADVQVDDVLA